ncbi:UNVERIFIED_CONTAM: hypothetical protein PYX00_005761 [Menopon gallinae]|uniref:Uncharacterized protein n=1 Tax=Menopon gallinae TaxID=328185 RepID=A0AAW2HSN6_9NEOP
MDANVPSAASAEKAPAAQKSGKRRPGKASKARRSEEFRIKMNQRQYEAKRKEIEKHFLSDDEMAESDSIHRTDFDQPQGFEHPGQQLF